MSRAAMRQAKRVAFRTGAGMLFVSWLLLTGALADQITLPEWAQGAGYALGAGLVIWGSIKSRVERLEVDLKDSRVDIERRVTREMFTQAHDNINLRLGRIEDKLDRRP